MTVTDRLRGEGRQAFLLGDRVTSCPYGGHDAMHWREGWHAEWEVEFFSHHRETDKRDK